MAPTTESDADWEEIPSSASLKKQLNPSAAPLKAPAPKKTSSPTKDAAGPPISSAAPPAAQPTAITATTPPAQVANKPQFSNTLTILSSSDVSTVLASLSLSSLLDSQSAAFTAYSSTTSLTSPIQVPPRISLNLPSHTSLFMPARASAVGGSAIKIVSVPSEGSSDTSGIPGTTVLLDEASGRAEAVVNASELTGVRTAAGSAVVSRMLLGEGGGRRKMVVFGTGVQAFWHAHLHLQLFPSLTHLAILARPSSNPTPRLQALISKLQPLHPNVHITHSSVDNYDRGQAVHNADLILCCTPSTSPLFPPTQPRSGTHIVLVGSYKPHMLEVDTELIRTRAGVVFVDSEEMTRVEAGELQGFEGEVCEVGSMLGEGGEGEARKKWEEKKDGGDLTVWKSVGLAVQDVAITRLVYEKAKEMGLGVIVPEY